MIRQTQIEEAGRRPTALRPASAGRRDDGQYGIGGRHEVNKNTAAPKLDRLQEMIDTPEEQAAYAERLFRSDKNPDVVRA
ncbi:MAG: hypothetical protein M3506_09325, partial [Chloroflexota bacterium]|nr:hypothetical protein [Chloroflexota bacterium]